MSTRGIIAKAYGDSWIGRYHHSDSNPMCLGRTLWALYHGHFKGDYDAMVKVLVDDHPAGWSYILTHNDSTGPADFTKKIQWEKGTPLGYKIKNDTYYEPVVDHPVCYCHGDQSRNIGDNPYFPGSEHVSLGWWTYVLSPQGMMVERDVNMRWVSWNKTEPDWEFIENEIVRKESVTV